MRLRILGCSGGIGGDLRTTSMLLDHDVLIDAGTGVGDLNIDELSRIDHVFVTHSHLDHVTSIPFMVDSVGWMRDRPITVHAIEPTLEILRQHLFNWKIWPDFTQIPDAQKPFLRYQAVALGKTVDIDGRKLTPLPANHVVPAVGYRDQQDRQSALRDHRDRVLQP
jgi:ribonuclease BN (tRNA processing enzyme)